MRFFLFLRHTLRALRERPAAACAAVALALRVACTWQSWTANPLMRGHQLDAEYYLHWARDIAQGDLAGRGGIVGGRPFLLNPLYAYLLAPFAAAFSSPELPIALAQALLGAGTTALAAAAARRFFGSTAAWVAGIAVAFSAVLVHLEAHVSVAGVAAFLVAGAVYACAPPPGRGRGPVAAGLWLGLGALARPIAPLALPFVAFLQAKRSSRPWRAALVVAAAAGVLALPTFLRNWIVAKEPFLYTGAGALNLHLGNNEAARRWRSMVSPWFRFHPVEMHEDARRYVQSKRGSRPSYGEVSDYFRDLAVHDFMRAPGASLAHYGNKARWFLSRVEVPSTASLANDRRFAPLLRIAFVPTWLLGAAALVGVVLHRRRADVLLGPGAILGAHLVVLTLVFPLSHYRAPAIPAMALLAGGAVEWALARWRERRRGAVAGAALGVAALAALGRMPPEPDAMRHSDHILLAVHYRDTQRWDEAEREVLAAMAVYREDFPDAPDLPESWFVRGEIALFRGDFEAAVQHLTRGLELAPPAWPKRLLRSHAYERLGDVEKAEADVRRIVQEVPEIPDGHARLGELLIALGRPAEARPHLLYALSRGYPIPESTRRAAGLR